MSRSRSQNVLSLTIAGVVAFGAVEVATNPSCVKAVMSQNGSGMLEHCVPHPHIGNSDSQISGIGVKDEKLATSAVILGIGGMAINMSGSATFNYDGGNWVTNTPFVTDYQIYYNHGNKKTTKIDATPCFTFGDDYKTALNLDISPGPNNAQDKSGHPENTVKIDTTYGPDGNTIEAINIDAGYIDLCSPHIANTPENNLLGSERWWSFGTFGASQRGTYTYLMDDLLIRGALAGSCLEEKLDMNAVKVLVKKVTIGELATDSKGNIVQGRTDELAAVDKANKITVSVRNPADRRAKYQKDFDDAVAKYAQMRSTLPNDGKTYNLDPLKIDKSEFKARNCTVNSLDFKPAS